MAEKIHGFLGKYQKIFSSVSANKDLCIECIYAISGIRLDRKELDTKNNAIHLQTHPGLKQKIFFYQKEILEALQKQGVKITKIY